MGLSSTLVIAFRLCLVAALVVVTHLATTQVPYPALSGVSDKLQHLAAFFALGLLADFSFPKRDFGVAKGAALLAYALAIELVQLYLPWRTFSWLDLGADAIGLLAYRLCIPALRAAPVLRWRWR